MFLSVYVLYMTRDLGLGPVAVGLVFATGGVGSLAGALVAGRVARRYGPGPAMLHAVLLFGLSGMAVPLAVLVPRVALPMVRRVGVRPVDDDRHLLRDGRERAPGHRAQSLAGARQRDDAVPGPRGVPHRLADRRRARRDTRCPLDPGRRDVRSAARVRVAAAVAGAEPSGHADERAYRGGAHLQVERATRARWRAWRRARRGGRPSRALRGRS